MIWKTTNGLGQEITWYSEDEVKHLNDLLNQALKELEKTRETLTEIKEIGETCSFTDSSELLLSRIEHILQKISECEVK